MSSNDAITTSANLMTDDELTFAAETVFLDLDRRQAAEFRAKRRREWALDLICWDGPLPFVIVSVPATVSSLFPKQDTLILLTYVFVPIAAFFIRAALANRHFWQGEQYGWQRLLFIVAIFCLVFFDALLIVLHEEAKPIERWILVMTMYLFYLPLIGLSLFPFRAGKALQNGDVGLDENG